MKKKYQVFISSTFRDLVDERQDTMRSVLDIGCIPSGMEIFPAADVEQFEYIKKVIDECDYYILIIAGRYGSMDSAGMSFTEKEYHYAIQTKKTVLAFPHGNPGDIAVAKTDTNPELSERLNRFREHVCTGRIVQHWTTREDLRSKVIVSLAKTMSDYPAVGWVRGNAVASESLLEQINDLRLQNDELKKQHEQLLNDLTPALPNLASFDSKFKIRNKAFNNTSQFSIEMTWQEIFLAVAPHLFLGRVPSIIATSLETYIKENKKVTNPHEIYETDLLTIKIQLQAYGLISTEVAKSVGGGLNEYITITKLGQKRLIESRAIRSAESESDYSLERRELFGSGVLPVEVNARRLPK